jgi:phosphatidylglycerol lysyltransferase
MGVLAISAVSHILKGLDIEEASMSIGVAAWLWWLRPHFVARSDGPSIRRGLMVLVSAIMFTLAYGAIGFWLLDRQFQIVYNLPTALWQAIVMFTQFYDPGLQPITGFGAYFADSIYVVGAVTLSTALVLLVQPVFVHVPASMSDYDQACTIVAQHGRTTLARFALLRDKSYFFSPGGSVVAFVARGRVALTLGDPIGPTDDLAATIRLFDTYCRQHDWQVAWYQIQEDTRWHYQAAGLQTIPIGQEAMVDLTTFSLKGKAAQDWRSAINRFRKLGYRASIIPAPIDDALLTELRVVSDAWLMQRQCREKRFSLGWFDEQYLRTMPILIVVDAEGLLMAFASLVPDYRGQQIGVDLMRYRPDAEKGIMDFLFVSLLQAVQADGYTTCDLGLSALAGVGNQPNDPALERAARYLYTHGNQLYNFQGLHAFKQKFQPVWSPRYVAYSRASGLPAVLTTFMQAEAGASNLWEYLRSGGVQKS